MLETMPDCGSQTTTTSRSDSLETNAAWLVYEIKRATLRDDVAAYLYERCDDFHRGSAFARFSFSGSGVVQLAALHNTMSSRLRGTEHTVSITHKAEGQPLVTHPWYDCEPHTAGHIEFDDGQQNDIELARNDDGELMAIGLAISMTAGEYWHHIGKPAWRHVVR